MTRLSLSALLALAALGGSTSAMAHGMFCQCQGLADGQVRCHGGLSDGTALPGATLDVIGYDEKIHIAGKLGTDSSFTFAKPDGEFYVLLEMGPGHTVEVDHKDIAKP